jgi:hypothetical protein
MNKEYIDLITITGRTVSLVTRTSAGGRLSNSLKVLGGLNHWDLIKLKETKDAQALVDWLVKKYNAQVKTIELAEIKFEVFPELETEPVPYEFGDSVRERILAEMETGDVWAWANVEVRATYKNTLVAKNFLGCCSYKIEKDFIENSGYYNDMKAELQNEIQLAFNSLVKALGE